MAKRKTKEEKLEGLSNFLDRSAKRLTKEKTKWESIMIKHLSDLHYKFQFQVPFIHTPPKNGKPKGYILDFLLTDYNIVIEIDSIQHHTSKKDIKYDNQRTKKLKLQGYEVIRLFNRQVSTYSKEMIDSIIKTKIDLINLKKQKMEPKDDKPTPGGAPIDLPKPVKTEEKGLGFSYKDLVFQDSFSIDNRKYLRFFVESDGGYFIDIARSEYLDYFTVYTDLFEIALKNEDCTCDRVYPIMDEIEPTIITLNIHNQETGEDIVTEEEFPVFIVHSLVETLEMSIHGKHTKNNDGE